jgi:hypothetical protein
MPQALDDVLLAASRGDLPAVKDHLARIACVNECMDQVRIYAAEGQCLSQLPTAISNHPSK